MEGARPLWLCLLLLLGVAVAADPLPAELRAELAAAEAAAPAEVASYLPDLRGDDSVDRLTALLRLRALGPGAAAATLAVAELLWPPAADQDLLVDGPTDLRTGELAAEVLATFGQPAVRPLVLALCSESASARSAAGRALRAISPRWALESAARSQLPQLLELLSAESADVRRAAAVTLGQLADPRAVEALRGRLLAADEVGAVRVAAARALAGLPGDEVVAALNAAMTDPDPELREAVVVLLGARRPAPTDALLAALADDAPKVRASAISALRYTRDGRVGPAVVPLVADPDPRVRAAAVIAIGDLRDPSFLDSLYGALDDPVRHVREEAVASLARIAAPESLDRVIAVTQGNEPRLRELAARALARFPGRASCQTLIGLLGDDPLVAQAAAASLRAISRERYGDDPAEWQAWLERQTF